MNQEFIYSKTFNNILNAMIGELISSATYQLYASLAEDEAISSKFKDISSQELEHAYVLGDIINYFTENQDSNLSSAIEEEDTVGSTDYPRMAKEAEEEGYEDIAEKFRLLSNIELRHKKEFTTLLDEYTNETLYKRQEKIYWHCTECGNEVYSLEPPTVCPLCSHSFRDYISKNYRD